MNEENIKISMIRCSCYRYTFQPEKLRQLVKSKIEGNKILNLFAGKTILDEREVRVDCDNTMPKLTYNMKAEEFLQINKDSYDTIIYDPPWNARKSKEKYQGHYIGKFTKLKDDIVDILNMGGIIISASYEIDNFGIKRGMKLEEVIVVNAGGEIRPFFITIERKIKNIIFEEKKEIYNNLLKNKCPKCESKMVKVNDKYYCIKIGCNYHE